MQEILTHSYFGNPVQDYLTALGIFIAGMLVAYGFKQHVLTRLKNWAGKTDTNLDDLLISALEKFLVPVLYFGVFYAALHTLSLTAEFKHGIRLAAIVLVTVLVVRATISMINLALQAYLRKTTGSDSSANQLRGMRGLINYVIWALALVFLLDTWASRFPPLSQVWGSAALQSHWQHKPCLATCSATS